MTDTTPHDTWTPEVGDDVEDRRTGSVAAVTGVSDRPTVFLRFKGSGVTTVLPVAALRRTYRPAAPTLAEATVTDTTQPAEPAEGSVVRDKDGDVWQRRDGCWYIADGDHDASTWSVVLSYAPLRLLIDGPVLT